MSHQGDDREPRLRIAQVAPVAQPIPPPRSGSIETVVSLLTDGLAARGHDVTLFATAASVTNASLHSTFERGYNDDPSMWPWEACELFNIAAAVERAQAFDVIHCHAEYAPLALAFTTLTSTPILQTVHHAPSAEEVAMWGRYPDAPFIAISDHQAALLRGLNVVGSVHHAVDTSRFAFQRTPEDYILFLGRFTEGKGVVEAIDIARRSGLRLLLAAAENDYYRDVVAPLVGHHGIEYVGEVDHERKVRLLGGARALLYPVQAGEPFGLVLAEAMICGTPVAALNRGSVVELVDPGVTGAVFDSIDALERGLAGVMALDRAAVHARAVERFSPDRMVSAYVNVYSRLMAQRRADRTA